MQDTGRVDSGRKTLDKGTGIFIVFLKVNDFLVITQRKTPNYFLSFSLAVQSVQQGLAEFKEELLAEYPFISPKLFQSELKLHLTIGMVYLLSESEVIKAKQLLDTKVKDMANQILGDLEQSNIQVKMKGIEIMNDDPYMTDIVYGKIEDPDELVQSKSRPMDPGIM